MIIYVLKGTPRITTSFRLAKDTLNSFKQKLPRKGDRTEVLEELIRMFLKGEVKIKPKTY